MTANAVISPVLARGSDDVDRNGLRNTHCLERDRESCRHPRMHPPAPPMGIDRPCPQRDTSKRIRPWRHSVELRAPQAGSNTHVGIAFRLTAAPPCSSRQRSSPHSSSREAKTDNLGRSLCSLRTTARVRSPRLSKWWSESHEDELSDDSQAHAAAFCLGNGIITAVRVRRPEQERTSVRLASLPSFSPLKLPVGAICISFERDQITTGDVQGVGKPPREVGALLQGAKEYE